MNKNIEKLIQLVKENPSLEIINMVNTEVFYSDDYGWVFGEIQKVEKDYFWQDDELSYVTKEDILEKLSELMNDDTDRFPEDYDITDEDIEKEFESLKNSNEIKEKIIIYINI